MEVAPKVAAYVQPAWRVLDRRRHAASAMLFEGAQAVMLDVDHGTYPFVTSSNTVAGQAAAGAGVGPSAAAMCWASSRPTPPASAKAPSPPS